MADNDDGLGNVSALRGLSEDDWCGDGRSDVMVIGQLLLVFYGSLGLELDVEEIRMGWSFLWFLCFNDDVAWEATGEFNSQC